MSASINNISVKLSKLKQLDTSFKIFGSIVHQYKIGPLITSNKMIEIEKKIGVTLPDGYRSFVMGIGNGGAGPYYGIYEFGDALNKSQKWLGDLLTQECPLTD